MSTGLTLVLLLLGQSGTSDEPKFPEKIRDRALRATVRVVRSDGRGQGSGVVIKRTALHFYVLTAAHVVAGSGKWEVHIAEGGKDEEKVVFRHANVRATSAEADLAVLEFRTGKGAPEPLAVCPINVAPRPPLTSTLNVGWAEGKSPTGIAEAVKRKVAIKRPGQVQSSVCWETKRKPVPGRSGGPMVDTEGRVIGIASGHDDQSGYYVHVEEIQRFLTRNGLKHLGEPEPAKRKEK